jgi:hypothetical protein
MPRPNLNGKAVTVYLPRDVKIALGNAAKGRMAVVRAGYCGQVVPW